MQKNNLTQEQFATLVGVTQGMVGHWVHRRHVITPAQAIVIERKTNGELSKEQLVFGDAA